MYNTFQKNNSRTKKQLQFPDFTQDESESRKHATTQDITVENGYFLTKQINRIQILNIFLKYNQKFEIQVVQRNL